jgi:hypothetical protein
MSPAGVERAIPHQTGAPVLPPPGVTPLWVWVFRCFLAADHVGCRGRGPGDVHVLVGRGDARDADVAVEHDATRAP